jgi:hypothetical protein
VTGGDVVAPGVDLARLQRAAHLVAVPLAPGRWSVRGGRAMHVVTLDAGRLRCDCVDGQMHPAVACKHRLAVALHRLPEPIRAALRDVVPPPRRRCPDEQDAQGRSLDVAPSR